jgi:mycoketide-CoA synthase
MERARNMSHFVKCSDAVVESSIPAVLEARANLQPNDAAFTYIDYQQDWGGVAESLTWSQLHRRTSNIAQEILAAVENSNDEYLATLPLATLVPRRLNRRLAGMAAGGASLAVTCSNVGDLSPAANRPDGTDAAYAYLRNLEPDIKKSTLE